jgi:hypothetical protein
MDLKDGHEELVWLAVPTASWAGSAGSFLVRRMVVQDFGDDKS